MLLPSSIVQGSRLSHSFLWAPWLWNIQPQFPNLEKEYTIYGLLAPWVAHGDQGRWYEWNKKIANIHYPLTTPRAPDEALCLHNLVFIKKLYEGVTFNSVTCVLKVSKLRHKELRQLALNHRARIWARASLQSHQWNLECAGHVWDSGSRACFPASSPLMASGWEI